MKERLWLLLSGFTPIFIGLCLIIVGSVSEADWLLALGLLFFFIIPTIAKLINLFG